MHICKTFIKNARTFIKNKNKKRLGEGLDTGALIYFFDTSSSLTSTFAGMVFLPGDHVLDINITVTNVATLTMHGESSSDNIITIVRNG